MRLRTLAASLLLAATPAFAQPTAFFQQLLDPEPVAASRFGASVDLSGDFVVVGEPGEEGATGTAFVYLRGTGTDTWALQQELAPANVSSGGEFDPAYGTSVAIRGRTIAVGAPLDSETAINSGAVIVFEYDAKAAAWTELDKLKASTPELEDQFGFAIAATDEVIVVGAYGDDDQATDAGAVYVYEREAESDSWDFAQKLVADDAEEGDRFGYSVAASGTTIAVGIFNEFAPTDIGAAYVFEQAEEDGPWEQVQTLEASDAEPGDRFGSAVGIGNDVVLVGAPQGGVGDSGAAYFFERDGNAWTEVARVVSAAPLPNSLFGQSVSVENGVALIGAPQEDIEGTDTGAAYLFVDGGTWSPVARLSLVNAQDDAIFGSAVSVSSGVAVVGAPQDNIDNNVVGAAYLFGVPATDSEGEVGASALRLDAPYPNPFSAGTRIGYTLAEASDVQLAVYDVLGREVAVLEEGLHPAGPHTVEWSARGLSAGIYIVRLQAGDTSITRRLLLTR